MRSWRLDSELFINIIDTIKKNVDDEKTRIDIYRDMINTLDDAGCDVIEELVGEDIAYDEAFSEFKHDKDQYADFDDDSDREFLDD